MMVKLPGMENAVRFEDSGLEPLVPGKFLGGVMKRGHVSVQDVARKAGMSETDVQHVLDGELPIDRTLSKKLNQAFPKLGVVLMDLQRDRDFFDEHGAVKPAQPTRLAALLRPFRQQKAAL